MSRCLSGALWAVVVAAALAGSACGRYGPPVRAHERAAAKREQGSPSATATEPTAPAADPDDQATPDQEP